MPRAVSEAEHRDSSQRVQATSIARVTEMSSRSARIVASSLVPSARAQDVCCAKLNLESENEYVEQRNRNTPKHIIGTLWVITPTR